MTQMSTPAWSARTHHSRSSRAETQVSSSQVKLGNQTPNRIVRLPTTSSFAADFPTPPLRGAGSY